jgi:6-phosphogluconolactonase
MPGKALFLYVSLAGDERIACYRIDERGCLDPLGETRPGGAPGSLAADPAAGRLFAAIRTREELASFRIDAVTGALTEIGRVHSGNAAFVGLDGTRRWLLSAYYQAGRMRVHRIGADGALDAQPVASVDTEKNAHLAVTSPDNRYLFVPHTGPNAIYQFRFDARTGSPAPNDPPRVAGPPGAGPRHLRFHPIGRWAYTADEDGSSVTLWDYDAASGRLSHLQTKSTLPAWEGENTCAEVRVHPSGRWVYVSNRGHHSLAIFRVDPDSGLLSAAGHAATEKTPRSFDLTPDGRFLYAGGEGGTRLAAYEIDAGTGGLRRIDTYEVGRSPAWIEVVSLEGVKTSSG